MVLIAAAAGCSRQVTGDIGVMPSRGAPAGPASATPVVQLDAGSPVLPPAETITDPSITQRIAEAVLSDPGMAGSDVSVVTSQGVVTLNGLVTSQEQAALASAHAQRQDGVIRVDSHLAVILK